MTVVVTEHDHNYSKELEDARVLKYIVQLDGFGHRRDMTLYELTCRTCGHQSHRYAENPPG